MENDATPTPNDDRTYFYEVSRDGEISQHAQDLEFNDVCYYPAMGYCSGADGKAFAMQEARATRQFENRRARAVKMTDGRWFCYVSYALNGE